MSDPTPPTPPPPPAPSYSAPQTAAPYTLSTKGKRFGAMLLEGVLVIVTLVIGWLVWSIILWKKGQTPAKSILKMRVINLDQNRAANVGEMAMREIVGKWLLSVVPFWYVINGVVLLADNDKYQCLWDKIVKTTVIDDPDDRWVPPGV
ncbi:MAG TPA: RDD family protein [Acidimicrobiales bacterium]|nr:RDD family protein [Acidimicrobiales bacterium]